VVSYSRGRNEDVLAELKVDPVQKKSAQCEQNWLNDVSKMEDIRYREQLLHCRLLDDDLDH